MATIIIFEVRGPQEYTGLDFEGFYWKEGENGEPNGPFSTYERALKDTQAIKGEINALRSDV